jgi:hypothetical protein
LIDDPPLLAFDFKAKFLIKGDGGVVAGINLKLLPRTYTNVYIRPQRFGALGKGLTLGVSRSVDNVPSG